MSKVEVEKKCMITHVTQSNPNLRNRNLTDLPPRPMRRRAMPRQHRGTVSVVRL